MKALLISLLAVAAMASCTQIHRPEAVIEYTSSIGTQRTIVLSVASDKCVGDSVYIASISSDTGFSIQGKIVEFVK